MSTTQIICIAIPEQMCYGYNILLQGPSIHTAHPHGGKTAMPADPRAEYDAVAAELTATSSATSGKMFGMPCLKNNGKAFAGYFEGAMVFKLAVPRHTEALALSGARLFDPSGRGRPMKEWVEVPATHLILHGVFSDAEGRRRVCSTRRVPAYLMLRATVGTF